MTTDDKVHVTGILFNNSQLREYIPDMLGKTRGSNIRAEIDVSSARKLAGFRVLYTNFIDREVFVTLPENGHQTRPKCPLIHLPVMASMSNMVCSTPIMLRELH